MAPAKRYSLLEMKSLPWMRKLCKVSTSKAMDRAYLILQSVLHGNPSVRVSLEDTGVDFTVRFTRKHLEMFWDSIGELDDDSHGLIGKHTILTAVIKHKRS